MSAVGTPLVLKRFACPAAPVTLCGTHLFAHQLISGRTQWFTAQWKGGSEFFHKKEMIPWQK